MALRHEGHEGKINRQQHYSGYGRNKILQLFQVLYFQFFQGDLDNCFILCSSSGSLMGFNVNLNGHRHQLYCCCINYKYSPDLVSNFTLILQNCTVLDFILQNILVVFRACVRDLYVSKQRKQSILCVTVLLNVRAIHSKLVRCHRKNHFKVTQIWKNITVFKDICLNWFPGMFLE